VAWEVESTENGLGRDLLYTPDGTVVGRQARVYRPYVGEPTARTTGGLDSR